MRSFSKASPWQAAYSASELPPLRTSNIDDRLGSYDVGNFSGHGEFTFFSPLSIITMTCGAKIRRRGLGL